MSIVDIIRVALDAMSYVSDETMARILLDLARSPLNDGGDMFDLWCDNCRDCESAWNSGCTDEAQIGCILRFLHSKVIPENE